MKMRWTPRGALLPALLPLLAAGCLSPRPDPSIFLVLTPAAAAEGSVSADVLHPDMLLGVGPVTLPAYLDRPQLVTRLEATELAIDPFARWSAPLEVLFAQAVADHLAAILGPRGVVVHPWASRDRPTHSVRIVVQQFEPVAPDHALLRVRWHVAGPPGAPAGAGRTSEFRTPSGGSPGDSALALSELVAMLAAAIATELR